MTDYNREAFLEYSKELYDLATICARYAHREDIKDEDKKAEFLQLSQDIFFKSAEISRIVTHNDVEKINEFTKEIEAYDEEIKETIGRLQDLEIKIQEIGATVGIVAEIAQIAAKLSKFAA